MKSKIIRALLSFFIALGLWLYVITVVSPGSDAAFRDVPVTLQNENVLAERGLMVTSYTERVNLTLAGNRVDLNKLSSSNIAVSANLQNITAEGTYQLSYVPSYSGNVSGNAVTVQKRSPDYVTVTVEERKTKTVEVQVEFTGSVPQGFIADKENIELDYQQVEISGPASTVEQITAAKIRVDLGNKRQTVSGTEVYTLCDAAGDPVDAEKIVTNAEAISYVVHIQRVKEIKLTVKLVDGGGATEKNTTVTVSPAAIRISGSEALLEGLEELEIGTIDLGSVMDEKPLVLPVTMPEGISNETGVNEARVTVRFRDLKVKTLSISDIKTVNVPEGMRVDMITQALEVKVRGPADLLDTITEKHVTVTVDFSGAQPGTATMKATVSMDSAYASVGAMGTYSVSCTVSDSK